MRLDLNINKQPMVSFFSRKKNVEENTDRFALTPTETCSTPDITNYMIAAAGYVIHNKKKIIYQETNGSSTVYYSRHQKGGDLSQHQTFIQEQCAQQNSGALSYVFETISQLVKALVVLHNSQFEDENRKKHVGIIHNDVKLSNIFVGEEGVVVLADFGCAYTAPKLFSNEEFCKKI